MANPMINVNIIQNASGFSATVVEFPDISVENAANLDELRRGVELAISVSQANGGPRKPVNLPPFTPAQVTRL